MFVVFSDGIFLFVCLVGCIPVSSKGPEFQPDLKYQPAAETENSGGK